jgi:hypothetical protein
VRGKKMLLPPLLTTVLGLLAVALVGRAFWPLLPAFLLLLVDGVRTDRRIRAQGLTLAVGKIFLARARTLASLAYYLGYHLLRYYLVPLLLVSCLYPPFGLLVLLALGGVATVDHQVRQARLNLPLFCFYYFLEQLAYGSGAFMGCLRLKNFSSYRLNLQAD